MEFCDNKILITGASGYIGGVIASALSRSGAKVVITGRNEEKLNQLYGSLAGGGHEMIAADLCNTGDIEKMIGESARAGGKFTGAVHCAAHVVYSPLRTLTTDKLAKTMHVNFYSFIDIVRTITKKAHFDERGGSIVALSSIAADLGEPGQTAYSAAKAALDASVRTLSFELAPKNIRINSIRAGVIKDNPGENYKMLGSLDNDNSQLYESKQLLGAGAPEDIANVALFLLSEDSKFITGRYIYADGGRFK